MLGKKPFRHFASVLTFTLVFLPLQLAFGNIRLCAAKSGSKICSPITEQVLVECKPPNSGGKAKTITATPDKTGTLHRDTTDEIVKDLGTGYVITIRINGQSVGQKANITKLQTITRDDLEKAGSKKILNYFVQDDTNVAPPVPSQVASHSALSAGSSTLSSSTVLVQDCDERDCKGLNNATVTAQNLETHTNEEGRATLDNPVKAGDIIKVEAGNYVTKQIPLQAKDFERDGDKSIIKVKLDKIASHGSYSSDQRREQNKIVLSTTRTRLWTGIIPWIIPVLLFITLCIQVAKLFRPAGAEIALPTSRIDAELGSLEVAIQRYTTNPAPPQGLPEKPDPSYQHQSQRSPTPERSFDTPNPFPNPIIEKPVQLTLIDEYNRIRELPELTQQEEIDRFKVRYSPSGLSLMNKNEVSFDKQALARFEPHVRGEFFVINDRDLKLFPAFNQDLSNPVFSHAYHCDTGPRLKLTQPATLNRASDGSYTLASDQRGQIQNA